MSPTVPDGPDTELTAAIERFREQIEATPVGHAVRLSHVTAALILDAVLARPAAGQPPANDERECVAVPRSTLLDWRRALLRAVDRTVNPTASALAFAAGEVGYWGQQPAAPADDTAAPDHPLPWRRDGNSYLRSIVDANDVRVGWMHPPELAAALVKAVNQWGRRAIGVPVAVLDALPDRDPFADEDPAGQPVRDSQAEVTDA